MNLVDVETAIAFAHHVKPVADGINRHAFRFADASFAVVLGRQIKTLQNPVLLPVVVEQTLALIAGDPDGVALSVVAEA